MRDECSFLSCLCWLQAVPVNENVAPAPAVSYAAPAPGIEYAEPAVTDTAPAPMIVNVAPAPAVSYSAPAPVFEYAASERAATYTEMQGSADGVVADSRLYCHADCP